MSASSSDVTLAAYAETVREWIRTVVGHEESMSAQDVADGTGLTKAQVYAGVQYWRYNMIDPGEVLVTRGWRYVLTRDPDSVRLAHNTLCRDELTRALTRFHVIEPMSYGDGRTPMVRAMRAAMVSTRHVAELLELAEM